MPSSWKASLNQLLNQQRADSRIAIVGIGNILRSDDAAGILVVRLLKESRLLRDLDTVLVMDAGHAPENSTAELRRFSPDMVLLIDAAEIGDEPGTIRLIEMDEIDGLSASTHTLPLSMLARFLNWEFKCEVVLLGIQPASNDVGETVHVGVLQAVYAIVEVLQNAIRPQPELAVS